MKDNLDYLERFRKPHPVLKSMGKGRNGFFLISRLTHKGTTCFTIQSSDGNLWEHVSVSIPGLKRLPTWEEMDWIKTLFWDDDETVIQFHPKKSEHRSIAEVLHLWKKCDHEYELPPRILVGPEGT